MLLRQSNLIVCLLFLFRFLFQRLRKYNYIHWSISFIYMGRFKNGLSLPMTWESNFNEINNLYAHGYMFYSPLYIHWCHSMVDQDIPQQIQSLVVPPKTYYHLINTYNGVCPMSHRCTYFICSRAINSMHFLKFFIAILQEMYKRDCLQCNFPYIISISKVHQSCKKSWSALFVKFFIDLACW